MLVVGAPWLAWLRYTRRRPSTRPALLAWSAMAGGVVVMLLASPLWRWAGPALAVVLSETVRTLTERIRQNQRPLSAPGAGAEEQRTR